jgi:hypothetical protein
MDISLIKKILTYLAFASLIYFVVFKFFIGLFTDAF